MSDRDVTQSLAMTQSRTTGPFMGSVWLLVAVVAALPLFWDGFGFLGTSWLSPEYSHGPVIPILSTIIFLREVRQLPEATGPIRDRWPGLLIVTLGLALALFGNLTNIPDIIAYALIIWIGGLVLAGFGLRRGWIFWPSVLHLVFMLPLPNFVYWQMTIQLQLVSSELGVAFLQLLNIPVYLEGNVIDLGLYKLQVAEACSGLRYLFPILSFSYVFCVLYNGPKWHKAVLLLAAAPITILMNSFRIGMIGVLVDRAGIDQAEGFLHFFEGWIIFGACVAILFLMAILMQRLQKNPKPISQALDLDFHEIGAHVAPVLRISGSIWLVLTGLVTVAITSLWLITPPVEPAQIKRDPFVFFPLKFEAWEGQTEILTPEIEQVLDADDYIQVTYQQTKDPGAVGFFSAFYRSQSKGSAIHSPRVCLPGGGWEIFEIRPVVIDLSAEIGWTPFTVNRAIIQRELSQQVVYYWFEQRGQRLTNDFMAKFMAVIDAYRFGRTDGALVRFTSPVLNGETVEDADRRIMALLEETLPHFPTYLPE